MRNVFAALAMVALSVPAPGSAEDIAGTSPFLFRLRPVYISPANKSDAIPALGVPSDAIHVNGKFIPEADITYFFSDYVSAELILTYPQEHDVTVSGTKIGTFSHLPPVLTLQAGLPYRFLRPYVGAGVNLTLITSQNLEVPGVGPLRLDRTSVGFAGQVGVDVQLASRWSLNADVKYVTLGLDVNSGGHRVTSVGVNPWLIGAGLAYRL